LKKPLYRLKVPDAVAELIRGMHPVLKKKTRFALRQILNDPCSGKSLKGELAGLWSFRVGSFRIIYRTTTERTIDIIAVGPRKVLYEKTYRIIRKEAAPWASHRQALPSDHPPSDAARKHYPYSRP
jgi:mRNA-degrading endonuclease RelE of RelBE toxin-antitoxin system